MRVERGKIKYVPRSVLNEIDKIKRENNMKRDVIAFNKLLEHARVGKEVERIYTVWNPFYKKVKKKKR